jgi:hypothetical protein
VAVAQENGIKTFRLSGILVSGFGYEDERDYSGREIRDN